MSRQFHMYAVFMCSRSSYTWKPHGGQSPRCLSPPLPSSARLFHCSVGAFVTSIRFHSLSCSAWSVSTGTPVSLARPRFYVWRRGVRWSDKTRDTISRSSRVRIGACDGIDKAKRRRAPNPSRIRNVFRMPLTARYDVDIPINCNSRHEPFRAWGVSGSRMRNKTELISHPSSFARVMIFSMPLRANGSSSAPLKGSNRRE